MNAGAIGDCGLTSCTVDKLLGVRDTVSGKFGTFMLPTLPRASVSRPLDFQATPKRFPSRWSRSAALTFCFIAYS